MANQCYVPLELETAVSSILPLVARYKQQHTDGLELGFRFGHTDANNAWKNGVSAAFFASSMQLLRAYKGWLRVEEQVWMHDYFYSVNDAQVRTTMSIGKPCVVTHVKRGVAGERHVRLHDSAFHVRVLLKTEEPMDATALPAMIKPERVRLLERTSFHLENWRFDFTRAWHGSSRLEAEEHNFNDDTEYNIEVRFTGSKAYLMTLTDEYMATSALMKACSILGSGVVRMEPMGVK